MFRSRSATPTALSRIRRFCWPLPATTVSSGHVIFAASTAWRGQFFPMSWATFTAATPVYPPRVITGAHAFSVSSVISPACTIRRRFGLKDTAWPKRAPQEAQESPKTASGAPNSAPRAPQERPKRR
eukprot:4947269-Pyramimonas_sp.AAC.1